MTWKRIGQRRFELPPDTAGVVAITEYAAGPWIIESRRYAERHASGSGVWYYTRFHILRDGKEVGPGHTTLAKAKAAVERMEESE